MTESTRQWKRRAQVVIGKAGSGLLVEDLRISFEVSKTVEATPNQATIRIYNLAPANEAKVKGEFDEVLLNCGYEDGMRLVFRGNIKHVYRYRDGKDYITEIEAGDGDRDYQNAVMNETLAAGTTNRQLVQRAVGSFASTAAGYTGDVPDKPRLRGKVISGSTRDVLGDVARDSGASWSIQDGALVIVSAGGVIPGQAVVLRSDTGLLGAPEVNEKGITAKCLLNPQIRVNGAVQLDNNGIRAKRKKAEEGGGKEPIRLDPDGLYKAVKITHKGDTRGADWITEVVCVALDAAVIAKATKK